jgi:hypothetical protein
MGAVFIIDDVSVDIVLVESVVVVSVLVELSLHATKTVETARAIINFFIFWLFSLKIYFVFIPKLLKGNLCYYMKILHLHFGLLFR